MSEDRTTHFGFRRVDEDEKAAQVERVFSSVAPRYDLMNDVLSGGLHRLWKAFTIRQSGVRPGMRVLDVAAGTGDLGRAFAREVGPDGLVVLTDVNARMLTAGRDRLMDEGSIVPAVRCDAERLPFPDRSFDVVSVGFGLRNMTHKEQALAQMRRVLRPGGRLLVLEFSKIWQPLAPLYDTYSMRVMPWLGQRIAGDGASYRYLAESIRMHPSQQDLASMMEQAGLERVQWFNFAAGICALHVGYAL
ncbi:MAG TPA: bifunctional demethylmenaquinone methyltransferase/2-methoxy-6-polyprenyl-1,4-benzoquinol methylase UbiE [Burkholderiaceae bacterium]|jgi:demethylmenaquinone methyltransferase/2-methoxy-6-polyprenyl-1,4-benzoquinol methylase|nr:bifunctional demethylmenaquinone methyltransferase/2-methoxy-6-polyprenyl-1,4-benzoquinol methylase UbiE [Burkholderiaceae bacterium]